MTDSDYDMIGLKIQNSMDEIANLDQRIQQSERRTSRPAGSNKQKFITPSSQWRGGILKYKQISIEKMKKIITIMVLISLYLSISVINTKANNLWGLTLLGGAHNKGAIIKIKDDGSNFQNVYSFDSINGTEPFGNLLLVSNGLLYGTTCLGGTNDQGVIFSFDTATLTINVVHNCIANTGNALRTTLIQAHDGKLYGLASKGGANNSGVLFSLDLITNVYTDLYDFAGNSSWFMNNGLFQANNELLYGMHYYGGANSSGYIFSYDLTSNIFTDIHDFTSTDGQYPNGGLVQYNNGLLYGMTSTGGSIINDGVLFSIDPLSTSYTVLHNFDQTTGFNPKGNLLQVGNYMYGLTFSNNNPSKGTIFRFDPSNNAYDTLYNFVHATGSQPNGSLIRASNGKLYGMTSNWGAHSLGVIFSFDLATNTYTDMHDFTTTDGNGPNGDLLELLPTTVGIPLVNNESDISIYPNPANNTITIHQSTIQPNQLITIIDVLGRIVFSQPLNQSTNTTIDISKLNNGIYFYEVNGQRGKFVKE